MAPVPSPVPGPGRPPRPRGVLLICLILLLEAVAAGVLAVGFVGTIFSAATLSVGGSVFMAVLLVLLVAGLVTMVRKLLAGFRWPRAPSLVLQLFLVILAFPYFSDGNPVIGLLLLVPAAGGIVAPFSRPVVQFTVRTNGTQTML
ncbi:hypothetical protein AC792_05480 [Arthrobacter sp. RIT-PI-e]|uniref:hypothetical protein n=1 Tax=Arthrobacter sp. RIT-PI-e TaxID=1681197 RepID=UPI0006A01983|nr:hypothetical protein [Arthrobacter sp. RIT-PI-e]KNC19547.1 hypothetical protein AC792_05480 [Arthrobacter sp. RIT-PI-e]